MYAMYCCLFAVTGPDDMECHAGDQADPYDTRQSDSGEDDEEYQDDGIQVVIQFKPTHHSSYSRDY